MATSPFAATGPNEQAYSVTALFLSSEGHSKMLGVVAYILMSVASNNYLFTKSFSEVQRAFASTRAMRHLGMMSLLYLTTRDLTLTALTWAIYTLVAEFLLNEKTPYTI